MHNTMRLFLIRVLKILDLLDQINFKNNVRDAVDDVYMAARLTRIVHNYSDTCSDDCLDDNGVNSDDDGRDDHVLDDNDDPNEKNEANSDFQKKIDHAFKTKRMYLR